MGAALGGVRSTPERRPAWWRAPLLLLGVVALAAGALAGLARLGYTVPEAVAGAAALHGPLMVCGFFGVVIALERAVAIGRAWAYAAPLLAGLGSAAALHGATEIAPWLYLGGSIVLLLASLDVWRRQREWFTFTIALAAACWSAGVAAWALGAPVHAVVPWWLAFLVLTIAGERLELSRFMPPSPRAQRVFALLLLVAVLAMIASLRWPLALRGFGAGLLGLALWLLKQDIARRTVRQRGLTRFIAVCLLSGYFWLAVGGAIIATTGALQPGAPAYDAALHAVLLGFVFAMVFGHAPIIFPAVLRVAVPYHPIFYVPLAVLHGSLLLRLAGDAAGLHAWQRLGGLLAAVALALFIAVTAGAAVRGRLRGAA
ncbi:MAG TPA: hypothetical protein VMT83_13330 [Burkholderiaceae bacterium]|nr:hypothetical protein [Burkholderiaceae bacterium]